MGNFDKIMRENLGKLSKGLLQRLLTVNVMEAIPMPPIVRKTLLEKETDNLFLVKPKQQKKFILHLEFQSTNDTKMPLRMAVYNYMAQYIYGKEVVSIVIYVGEEKLTMKNVLLTTGGHYAFKLIDIRDMEPDLFLESENPKEVILAILAGQDEKKKGLIINQIINKLQLLIKSESELTERLEELEIISLLRGKDTQELIIKQKETMPIVIDIRKDLRYQQGRAEEKKERDTAFVTSLLHNTSHTIEQIAALVDVPVEFVVEIKKLGKTMH